jgi:hypothetical protein
VELQVDLTLVVVQGRPEEIFDDLENPPIAKIGYGHSEICQCPSTVFI